MDGRIREEFELLCEAYPDAVYKERWILLPDYPLPKGWSVPATEIAFFLKPPYPGISPYGIYTPIGLSYLGKPPANYAAANPPPPYPGNWGVFSWQAEQWLPGTKATDGHNMLTWIGGIRRRFLEGV